MILLWTVVVTDISVASSSFLGSLLTVVFCDNMWNKNLKKWKRKFREICYITFCWERNEQTYNLYFSFQKVWLEESRANHRTQKWHYSDTESMITPGFSFSVVELSISVFFGLLIYFFYLKLWSLTGLKTFLLNLSKCFILCQDVPT